MQQATHSILLIRTHKQGEMVDLYNPSCKPELAEKAFAAFDHLFSTTNPESVVQKATDDSLAKSSEERMQAQATQTNVGDGWQKLSEDEQQTVYIFSHQLADSKVSTSFIQRVVVQVSKDTPLESLRSTLEDSFSNASFEQDINGWPERKKETFSSTWPIFTRTWLKEKGSVYLHNKHCTPVIASKVYQALIAQKDELPTKTTSWKKLIELQPHCAFLLSRQIPDPNAPSRQFTQHIVVLVPSEANTTSIPTDPSAFSIPTDAKDAAQQGWSEFQFQPPTPAHPPTQPAPLTKTLHYWLIAGVLLIAAFAFFAFDLPAWLFGNGQKKQTHSIKPIDSARIKRWKCRWEALSGKTWKDGHRKNESIKPDSFWESTDVWEEDIFKGLDTNFVKKEVRKLFTEKRSSTQRKDQENLEDKRKTATTTIKIWLEAIYQKKANTQAEEENLKKIDISFLSPKEKADNMKKRYKSLTSCIKAAKEAFTPEKYKLFLGDKKEAPPPFYEGDKLTNLEGSNRTNYRTFGKKCVGDVKVSEIETEVRKKHRKPAAEIIADEIYRRALQGYKDKWDKCEQQKTSPKPQKTSPTPQKNPQKR